MTWERFTDLFPVLTLIAGFGLGLVGEQLRDRRTSERERRKWRAEFQRDSLLHLQEALAELEDALTDAVASVFSAYQQGGAWKPLSPLDPRALKAAAERRKAQAVLVRLEDQRARDLGIRYLSSIATALEQLSRRELLDGGRAVAQSMNDRASTHTDLSDRLGELVRASY